VFDQRFCLRGVAIEQACRLEQAQERVGGRAQQPVGARLFGIQAGMDRRARTG
jgi:hypothetical protein